MLTIIQKVLWIFVMIAIGVFLNKKDIVPYSTNQYLIKILLMVTTPCMIFEALASRELSEEILSDTITVLIGSIIYFAIAVVFTYFIAKTYKLDNPENRSVYMVIMTALNTGFMGFPITKALFGSDMFYLMVIQNVILTVYLYIFMPVHYSFGCKEKADVKSLAKNIISPCTIATLLGVVFLFGSIKLPASALDGISMIGDMTTPLSMIVVGIELGQSRIKEIIANRYLRISSLISMIIMPALTLLGVYYLPISNYSKALLVFAAAFPTAVVTVAISSQEKKDSKLAAEGVALTTAISIVTIPLWALLLNSLFL